MFNIVDVQFGASMIHVLQIEQRPQSTSRIITRTLSTYMCIMHGQRLAYKFSPTFLKLVPKNICWYVYEFNLNLELK